MTAPLSRLMDEQPPSRIDGSIHVDHTCYECGASNRDVLMDPICRFNVTTGGAEWRFCCAEIGPCSLRKAAVKS